MDDNRRNRRVRCDGEIRGCRRRTTEITSVFDL